MGQAYLEPQPFYLQHTENIMFKPCQVFLQHLPTWATLHFRDPSGQLAKTVSAILYLPQRECAVCCVCSTTATATTTTTTTTQLPGSSKLRGKPNTGLAVLNVDFFQMWCFYLIHLLHVFCYLSKHVLWKSSSLNVKLYYCCDLSDLLSLRCEGNEWCC